MESYLSTRPVSFPSIAAGIEWHTRSRTIRNHTSARVSVPPLLVDSHDDTVTTSTTSTQRQWTWRTDLSATKPFWEKWFVGLSQKFLEARGGKLLLLAGTDRLDKELTIGQMQGLSPPDLALDCICHRACWRLVSLTRVKIGKYQLAVFPDAGHFVHEDQPAKTAQVVADFYRRNDRSALVLPPKVGDMLKDKSGQAGKGILK